MERIVISRSRFKSYLTKEKVNEVYGAGAKMYDEIMEQGWRSLIDRQKVVDTLELNQNHSVLEIGVGTGLNLQYYIFLNNVTGIDMTIQMLDISRQKYPDLGDNLILMDAETLDFDDESFDSILTTLVVSAAPNPEKLLEEAYRVVKPGGKISILDVCKSTKTEVSNIQEALILPYSTTTGFPAPNEDIPGGVIVYQPNRDILEMCKQAGWNIETYEYYDLDNPFTCRIYLSASK